MRSAAAATSSSWVTSRIVWPPACSRAEQLEHLVAALGVERAGRLVGEQQRRLVGERAGDREPLALAAGQHARRVASPCRRGRAGRAGRGRGSRPACAGAPAITAGSTTFSSTRHALEQVEELEDDADVAAPHAGPARPRCLPDDLLARRRVISPSSAMSSPATRFSSVDLPQPDGPMTATNSPALTVEVDAAQRADRRALGLEGLAHAADATTRAVARHGRHRRSLSSAHGRPPPSASSSSRAVGAHRRAPPLHQLLAERSTHSARLDSAGAAWPR